MLSVAFDVRWCNKKILPTSLSLIGRKIHQAFFTAEKNCHAILASAVTPCCVLTIPKTQIRLQAPSADQQHCNSPLCICICYEEKYVSCIVAYYWGRRVLFWPLYVTFSRSRKRIASKNCFWHIVLLFLTQMSPGNIQLKTIHQNY